MKIYQIYKKHRPGRISDVFSVQFPTNRLKDVVKYAKKLSRKEKSRIYVLPDNTFFSEMYYEVYSLKCK